jgi:hypothetical protein
LEAIAAKTDTITTDIAVVVEIHQPKSAANPTKTMNQVNNPIKMNTMHRRTGFLTGLVVAVVTFGSLWFSLGPEHFNRGHKFCESEHCGMMVHHQTPCCDESKTVQVDVTNDTISN